MEIKYFLFYQTYIGGVTNRDIKTFPTMAELNTELESLEGVVLVKVISGFLLEDRG